MRALNQYRLVFIRHHYDEYPASEPVKETDRFIKTYTKWRPWQGQTIKTTQSNEVEFRYKENA